MNIPTDPSPLLPSIRAIATITDLVDAANALACRAAELSADWPDVDMDSFCEALDDAATAGQDITILAPERMSLLAAECDRELRDDDRRAGVL